jgi:hypothetical protein
VTKTIAMSAFPSFVILLAFAAAPAAGADVPIECSSGTTMLQVGDIVSCVIDPAGDSDLFQFEGTVGHTLLLTVTDRTGGSPRPVAQILDPTGDPVGPVISPSDTGELRQIEVVEAGTYTVLVTELGNDQAVFYSLALQSLFPAPSEAQTLVINDAVANEANPIADSDVYLFEGVAGETLLLTVTDRTGGSPRTVAQIYDPSGDAFGAEISPSDIGALRQLEMVEAGTYTVLVREVGDDQTVSYSIALQSLFPAPPEAKSLCSGCVAEESLSPIADTDVFLFHAAPGQTLIFTLTDRTGGNPRALAQLFGPDGALVTSLSPSDSGANTILNPAIAGVYTVLLTEVNDNEVTAYSVALQCLTGSCDTDGDTFPDDFFAASCVGGPGMSCNDNCPSVFNMGQEDTGTVASPVNPTGGGGDGAGDACQCGDVSGDARVLGNDATLIRRFLLALPVPASFRLEQCNVTSTPGNAPARCEGNDATVIRRALLGLSPGAMVNNCLGPRSWSEGRE